MWSARIPRPDADRLEYQLHLTRPDGTGETVCDPANPRRAAGPFGAKSVLELPGYRPPAWTRDDSPLGGDLLRAEVELHGVAGPVAAQVWTSRDQDPEACLPLLVVHDGAELVRYAGLLHFLDRLTVAGRLPPLRAALLSPPGDRDESYSASAAYAAGLARELRQLLRWLAPTPEGAPLVGMGASLGALAMLHAQRLHPPLFEALFLQSGSYFRRRSDPHETGFPRFRRISRFVGDVLSGGGATPTPVPLVMTCGAVEENLANNRAVAAALGRQGYDVTLAIGRDGHNWTAWRDTFDPQLAGLLSTLWG